MGEEREAEWELSLPTALLKCQKNTLSKKQTHALSLFTAAGSGGEQPVHRHSPSSGTRALPATWQPCRDGAGTKACYRGIVSPGPPPSPPPPPQPRDKGQDKSQPCRARLLGTTSSPEEHKGPAGTKRPQPGELAAVHQLLLDADDNDEPAELRVKPDSSCPFGGGGAAPCSTAWGFSELPRCLSTPKGRHPLRTPCHPGRGCGASKRKDAVNCHCPLDPKK